ncbi:hypothetical protein MPH_05987 [Macrophomina phaseolina MS6]|uniref:Uncharacterized protein n=1 Tax=Macrophomina phaseolina (strain MS6) TaxID=1126212 RepID=K2S2P9_MACPH|nr:hypothetical protein MPH_05987 [Macrophomina phaseolina MS6]
MSSLLRPPQPLQKIPDGGWESVSTLLHNYGRQTDFLKAGNPGALAPVNPPPLRSASSQELEDDLAAMGITTVSARGARARGRAAAATLPEIDVSTAARAPSAFSPERIERSCKQWSTSDLRAAVDATITPPAGGEQANAEKALVDKLLSHYPTTSSVDAQQTTNEEDEAFAQLLDDVKTGVARQAAWDAETLAKTARLDDEGVDNRTESEKEATLAEEFYKVMQTNAKAFFEHYPAVNSTKRRRRRRRKRATKALAVTAAESQSISGENSADGTTTATASQTNAADEHILNEIVKELSQLMGEKLAEESAKMPATGETTSVTSPSTTITQSGRDPATSVSLTPATPPAHNMEIAVSTAQPPSPIVEDPPLDRPVVDPTVPSSPASSPRDDLSSLTYILRDYPHPTTHSVETLLRRSLKANSTNTTTTTTTWGSLSRTLFLPEPVVGDNNFILAHPLPIFTVGVPAPDMLVVSYTIDGKEGIQHEFIRSGSAPLTEVDWDDENQIDELNRLICMWLCDMGCHRLREISEKARWLWAEQVGLAALIEEGWEGEALYREFCARWAGRVLNVQVRQGEWRDITLPLRSEEALAEAVESVRRGEITEFGFQEVME